MTLTISTCFILPDPFPRLGSCLIPNLSKCSSLVLFFPLFSLRFPARQVSSLLTFDGEFASLPPSFVLLIDPSAFPSHPARRLNPLLLLSTVLLSSRQSADLVSPAGMAPYFGILLFIPSVVVLSLIAPDYAMRVRTLPPFWGSRRMGQNGVSPAGGSSSPF